MELVELPESSWCCGSAGIVATANPGCLLQLIHGAKQRGWNLRVVHPVTLLAEAYRRHRR